MKTSRRFFIKSIAAATGFAAAKSWADEVDNPLPKWQPGELELHFFYTGCGENMFYRFPDGTAVLNDTGEYYRPRDLQQVPLLPSPDRLGGEWMSRYIQRVYPEKTIDYAIFSHWHSDHIGHASFDVPEGPGHCFRYKTTPDGRKINGFLCVAEDFKFKRYFDHQYPKRGTYKTHDSSMRLLAPWVEEQKKKGLIAEPFKVGALNQIALLRDPEKYKDVFSVRNICANGVVWDGKDGVDDCAAEHVAATGKDKIPQNQLSMGFVVNYGKFRYWTGGDVQLGFKRKDGTKYDYETLVGERVGPVSVCKMNHHGCPDAMSEGFVKAVRAHVYISCIWCPGQIADNTLTRMSSPEIHKGYEAVILPNLMPQNRIEKFAGKPYMKNIGTRGASHIVVKVAPGGSSYKVYLVEAKNESMRVNAVYERIS